MPNTILCDVQASRVGLNLITESEELQKKKANSKAIGVLEGICSDFSSCTRNNNFYSKKLWENVLKSDYIKEMLETKTLFGELDHPSNRDELSLQEAAICCTNLWIDDQDECVKGTFDILPTEKGKLLKSICDYGSKIGVSSRGIGDVEPNQEGINIVNENTYYFICFDAVVQPAAIRARQKFTSLTESQKKQQDSILKSLIENVECSATKESLLFINNIADKLGFSKDNKFVNCYNNKLEQLKNNTSDNIIKKNEKLLKETANLRKDLEDAYKQINALKNVSSDTNSIMADLVLIRSQMSGLKSVVESSQNIIINEYKNAISQKEQLASEVSISKEKINSSDKLVESLKRKLKLLSEDKKRKEQKLIQAQKIIEQSTQTVKQVKQMVSTYESNKIKVEQDMKELKKRNEALQETNNKLRNSLEKCKDSLKESYQNGTKNEGLLENLLNEYITRKEIDLGIDLTSARENLSKLHSLQDIDLYIMEVAKQINPKQLSVMSALTESNRIPEKHQEGNSIVGQIFQQFNKS